jgi:stage II sporulation protein D
VTWTAAAIGGTGPYRYKFYVFNGATWTVGQDWSAANTWTWVPPTAGTYVLQVWVRNAGSGAVYDAWLGAGSVAIGGAAPLSVRNITTVPGSPLVVGGPAVIAATATGGTGPYTYQFWVYNGATWSIGQPWSGSSTFTWTPPAAGSYTVQVWIRNAGSGTTWDAWGGLGLVVLP